MGITTKPLFLPLSKHTRMKNIGNYKVIWNVLTYVKSNKKVGKR